MDESWASITVQTEPIFERNPRGVLLHMGERLIEPVPTWHPDWQPSLQYGDSITIDKPRFLRQTEADRYHEEEITLP